MENSSEKAIKNSFNKESKENSQKSPSQTVNNEKTTFDRYTKNLNPPHMGHPSSRGNLPVKTSPFKQTPERILSIFATIYHQQVLDLVRQSLHRLWHATAWTTLLCFK